MATFAERFRKLCLSNVEEVGTEIGRGAYGVVQEMRIGGLKVAGKTLFDYLQNERPYTRHVDRRFEEDCIRMSEIRHPNTVEFLGVYFKPCTRTPILVMEFLPFSLKTFLENQKDILPDMKYSILYDVSLGLFHLHKLRPPVIHRDLTVSNVLLTFDLRAKIANFGVSRIIAPSQMTSQIHLSTCPGLVHYMPPEALVEGRLYPIDPQHCDKLDIFSFGALILHVWTQEWPVPSNPFRQGRPLTEVQRRERYLKEIEDGSLLRKLAVKCLQNDTCDRPAIDKVSDELSKLPRNKFQGFSTEFLEVIQCLAQKESEFKTASNHCCDLTKKLQEKEQQILRQEEELHFQQQKLQHSWVELEAEKNRGMPDNTSGEPMKGTAELENIVDRPSLGQKEELHFQKKKLEESWAELEYEKKRQEKELHLQQRKLEHSWVEVEAENKRQEGEFHSQQRELEQSWVELEAEKSSQKKKLQTQQLQMDNYRAQLKADRSRIEKEKQVFYKLTSASHDSRKRNKDFRPGDITHEHLSTRFQEYFDTKHRTRLRKLKYTSKEVRCDFLSRVLEVACKYCNDQVMQHLSEELSALQQPPQGPRNFNSDRPLLDKAQENWRDRSAAFGLLLSVANIDPKERPEWIKKEEVQKLLSECQCFRHALNSNPDVAEAVLESAIELAWIMSTLLPPSSACKPTVYYPEWQELVTTSDSIVNLETDTDYNLVYCRPVLFFGAEGTVGKPGAVKCLPAEPLSLQTTREEPGPSQLDSSRHENQLEKPGKLANTSHKESTAFTAKAEGISFSSSSEATSSHLSTTDEQNDTSVLTFPLDDEGSGGANCNLQAACKSTTEEVSRPK